MSAVSIECPHCGRTLEVPEDAGKIVCMFCAQPIDFQKILRERELQTEDSLASLKEAERLLPDAAFTYRIRMGELNVKSYEPMFEDYSVLLRPAMQAFCSAALTDEGAAVEQMASLLFERFSKECSGEKPKYNSFECRFTITALTIPAILEYQAPAANKLADSFLQKWREAYPKQPLGKATHDEIVNGFRKKFCFITTATCASLQKGEPCAELDEFRAFRDGWLAAAPQGEEKICEYYLFAPIIVEAIERSGRGKEEYGRIWQNHLVPCLSDLRSGDSEACAAGYEAMMVELEQKWLSGVGFES